MLIRRLREDFLIIPSFCLLHIDQAAATFHDELSGPFCQSYHNIQTQTAQLWALSHFPTAHPKVGTVVPGCQCVPSSWHGLAQPAEGFTTPKYGETWQQSQASGGGNQIRSNNRARSEGTMDQQYVQ